MGNEDQLLEGQELEGQEEEGSGQSQVNENMIPKIRFDQVNNLYRSYKEFGTPDQIKADREELAKYRKAIENYNKEKNAQDPTAQVRDQLLRVAPEIGKFSEVDKLIQRDIDRNFDVASDTFSSILKDNKLTVTPKDQDFLETFLWHNMSQEQQNLVKSGTPRQIREVVREVFSENKDHTYFKSLKNQSSNAPPRPFVRHGAGGTPPANSKGKPLTHDEIIEQGFARLSNKG